LLYGVLMAHPGRVSPDHALGDLRGFRRAIPALRILLAEATAFTGEIDADVPVTIAWAGHDLVLPPSQAHVAGTRLPAAEHVLLRGAGHVPMWDDPERVASILLRGSGSLDWSGGRSDAAQHRHRLAADHDRGRVRRRRNRARLAT
jgi:pimeloyl-ACP methyl ester carboxylesterase